ncbi:acyl carrier protein [Nocardia farcinica]|nr:acyl carrier protein [Nocardia farcinica]MBF6372618.1 acyl carrier protein [Nocardia farcinica]
MLALELRNHLENAFALRLSATLLWTYGTVAALAQAIEDRLAAHPA